MNGIQFLVRTTSRFDRMVKALVGKHPDVKMVLVEVAEALRDDPFNRSRQHQIKKLEDVEPGDGQYRLRLGRWRIRYDIFKEKHEVVLVFVGLRREDTYR